MFIKRQTGGTTFCRSIKIMQKRKGEKENMEENHEFYVEYSYIHTAKYHDISKIVAASVKKARPAGSLSTSDKIDKVVTNRFLGLPIFIVVMFLVYYISMVTVGTVLTDWMNDGVFGDGYHLFGIGAADYEKHSEISPSICSL